MRLCDAPALLITHARPSRCRRLPYRTKPTDKISRYKVVLSSMLTDAVSTIEIIPLFTVGVQLARTGESREFASAGWRHGMVGITFDAVEVSIEDTWLSLASKQD